MINARTRIELQASAQEWVDSVMTQYNISAADMEDALNKVLLGLQQKIFQEYLVEQQQAYQNMTQASEQSEVDDIQ